MADQAVPKATGRVGGYYGLRGSVYREIILIEDNPVPTPTNPLGVKGAWPGASRWQLRDFARWMCAAAPCTMTGVSTGSQLQHHDHAE
jgi:hypothetical protein